MLKELVEQEARRGDCLQLEAVMQDLLTGGQVLTAVQDTEGATLMILLVQEVKDRLRPVRLLYINNFYMPSKDAFLGADLTVTHRDFADLIKGYDKVLFQTRNAALVRFLGGIGLTPQMEMMVYNLKPVVPVEEVEDGV
jgi:hypothetical protein